MFLLYRVIRQISEGRAGRESHCGFFSNFLSSFFRETAHNYLEIYRFQNKSWLTRKKSLQN